MPQRAESLPSKKNFHFRHKLARRTVLQVLLLALLPVIAVSTAILILSRQLLTNQLSAQFNTVHQNYANQLANLVNSRQATLDKLKQDMQFSEAANVLLNPQATESQLSLARWQILAVVANVNFSPGAEASFDQIIIADPLGNILFSTQPDWLGKNYSSIPSLQRLLGTNESNLIYDIPELYPNQTVLVSSRVFVSNQVDSIVTIMGFSLNNLPRDLLANIKTYFPAGVAYLYTSNQQILAYDSANNRIVALQLDENQQERWVSRISTAAQAKTIDSLSFQGMPILSYAAPLPGTKSSLIIEVPQDFFLNQFQQIINLSLLLLGVALVLVGGLVYLGINRIVRPLVKLSGIAQSFSNGDWAQRAEIVRDDEIGLLAHSFNAMVDQLTDLYQSLEAKVEDRTRQLRTASEVAQLAIQSAQRQEIAQRTAELITERFGFQYAAILLVDETNSYASIEGVSGADPEIQNIYQKRFSLSNHPQLIEVVSLNQARVNPRIDREDPTFQDTLILLGSESQVLVPISIGSEVIGILDVQSDQPGAFDAENLPVFQTLANQIAVGLRNIFLVEAAQVNLEETNLLYRTSRQIAQANNEAEVLQYLQEAMAQTSYVSLILSVEEDHLILSKVHDPRGGRLDANLSGISLPMQNGRERLAENHILIQENLLAPSEFASLMNFLVRRECRSAAMIPILVEGAPTLVIALGARDVNAFNVSSLQPFSSLAEVIGSSLNRFRLIQMLRQRLSELEMLASMSDTISTETDPITLFRSLHKLFSDSLGPDLTFAITLYDATTNTIEVPYIYEGEEVTNVPPFPLGEGLTSHLIRNKKPLLIARNAEQVARQLGAKTIGKHARSWMGAPLMVGGEVVGAVILQDTEKEERFSEQDLKLLSTVAPSIATAVRNAQLLSKMQQSIQAYEQEHLLLENLLHNIPEQVFFKNTEGRYLRVSASYLAHYPNISNASDLLGHTDLELQGEQAATAYREEQAIIFNGTPEIGKLIETVDPQDGTPRWFIHSRLPMQDTAGLPFGLMGIIQDVTELKASEQLSQRRAERVNTAAEIARDTAGTLVAEELLRRAVNVIRERFGFYHAGIFLIDQGNEMAVLSEATGEAGEKMKAAKHQLAIGSVSLVGRCAASHKPMLSNDVRKELNYFPNPLLPNTRSELAIPLIAGDELLGILDVQSTQINAFKEEDINTLQAVADQLATALLNSRLFTKTQENISKHRFLHQITAAAAAAGDLDSALAITVQSLRISLGGNRVAIFFPDAQEMLSIRASAGYEEASLQTTWVKFGEGIVGTVAQTRQPIRVNDTRTDPRYIAADPSTRSELAVPILFKDELLGVLNIESPNLMAYDENDQEILATLGNNLGSIIANANLVNRVRKQVERQRQLYEITGRIRRSNDIEAILQTSVNEIGQAIRAQNVHVRIYPPRQEEE